MKYTDHNTYASNPGGLNLSPKKWEQITDL